MKTIALEDLTFERLKDMKVEFKSKTFNELVEKLIKKVRKVPKSMFGVDRGMRPFTEKDELEFIGKEHKLS